MPNRLWFQIRIEGSFMGKRHRALLEHFARAYRRMGEPADVALYHEPLALNLVGAYFTPGIVDYAEGVAFLQARGATTCRQPDLRSEDISLVTGSMRLPHLR
jgi:hypothetical protein